MQLPIFLARRLSLSTSGHTANPAVIVAIIAVALSVAIMLAAIAIVLGFKSEIKRKVFGFNPHITLTAHPAVQSDDPLVSLSASLQNVLDTIPFIEDYVLSAAAPGVLKTDSDFKGVYIKSIGGERFPDFIASQIVDGEFPANLNDSAIIILSSRAANQLALKPGDKINTYFFSDNVKVRPMKVAAIFNSHFDAYDDIFAYSALPLIQDIGNLKPSEGTSIGIYVDNYDKVEQYAVTLSKILDNAYQSGLIYRYYTVDTANTPGAAFFSWLELLDINVVVILILMAAVACVTLVSGMLIIIVDKKRFIAVMKSLGASNKLLRATFIRLTIRVALSGILIGNILMLSLIYIQDRTHFLPLDPDSYYIDFVPVDISWAPVLILNIAVIIIAWLVLILPSRFVASVSPAVTLRNE